MTMGAHGTSGLSLALAAALGLGGLTLAAGPAVAAGTATYSCPAPVVGPQDSTTTYDTDLPASIPAGSAALAVGVTSSGVAKASATGQAWSLLGARKMTAVTDAPIIIGSGAGSVKNTVRMTGPTVPINNGGDTTLSAGGAWGTWTPPAQPAEVPVTLDSSYYTSVHLLKDNGSHTSMSPQNTTCTVKSGQNRVIDTVYVTASSTTTVSALDTSITEGESLEVSAEVAVQAGKAAGKVEFRVGEGAGQKLSVNLVNGRATGVMPGLEAGEHQLTATFIPTQPTIYLASASAETPITVTPQVAAQQTTTTVALDRHTVTTDDTVRATVTVTSAGGVPAGQARVVVNGSPYTADLTAGTATVSIPTQRAGSHQVTASFVPARSKEFAPSSSAPTTLVVTPGVGGDLQRTSVFTSFTRTSWEVGTTAAVTAQVTTESQAPVGRVAFTFDGRTMSAPVVNGRAVVSLPYLPVGTYRLTTTFVPGPGFEASTGSPVAFSVTTAGATPPVGGVAHSSVRVSGPASVRVGTRASVTASVSVSGGGAARGQVLFGWGTTTVSAPLEHGVARATVPVHALGVTALTARYEPEDPSTQKASSTSVLIRGVKAASSTRATARATRKAVTVTVRTTSLGSRCSVPVTITLSKGATVTRVTKRVTCAGHAKARILVRAPGRYRVKAIFAGTGAVEGSSGRTVVAVKKSRR